MSPIDNKPTLVQIMAWRRTGDKPLHEPIMAQFADAYMRHLGKMSYSNKIAADALVTQRGKASAIMVMTWFSRNIAVSTPGELT